MSSDDFKTIFLFSREAQEGPIHTHMHTTWRDLQGSAFAKPTEYFCGMRKEREKKLENAVGVCVNGGREQWKCVKESVRTCLSFLSAQVFWFWPQRSSKASEDF